MARARREGEWCGKGKRETGERGALAAPAEGKLAKERETKGFGGRRKCCLVGSEVGEI
jgi:hypothetical protein